ncbi:MAG: benzoyl-CoA reductase, bzd-type, subunit O [Dehalococcoidia bacterium]
MAQTRYETRPLECWQKAKELRTNYFKSIMTAKEDGKLLAMVDSGSFLELPAGLGDYVPFEGHPYAASVGADTAFSEKCVEAAESRGFARDMCAYTRNFWGSMFLNQYYYGGEFPRGEFAVWRSACESEGKFYQLVAEYMEIPGFALDFPLLPGQESNEDVLEYVADQLADCIKWMEKVTGREYDDEKLLQAARNHFESTQIWAEICTLNKAVPAPLDQKTIYTLYFPSVATRHEPETLAFYRALRDEVKDRVSDHIAAVPVEQCRLWDDGIPPWYFLRLYRYLEQYGVVVLGSQYTYALHGAWEDFPDGSWGPARLPQERGMPMKTRHDILRAIALWYEEKPMLRAMAMPDIKSRQLLRIVQDWHAEGMIMHANRGCPGLNFGQMENRLAMQSAGIPVIEYEGNSADKRELSEAQVLDRLDGFMESLGIKKLPL